MANLALTVKQSFQDQLDVLRAEFMMRAALGEDFGDDLLESPHDVLTITLVLGAIADLWDRDANRINNLIVKAEAEVARTGIPLAEVEP